MGDRHYYGYFEYKNNIHYAYLQIDTINENIINGVLFAEQLHTYSDGKKKYRKKRIRLENCNISNFYIDALTEKIFLNDNSNTEIICENELNNIPSMFVIILFLFIIGCSFYFSGWSNIVGGIKVAKEIFEVTQLCEYNDDNTHIVYGYFNISNSAKTHKCELMTGYSFTGRKECLNKFENKYSIGSLHNIYYDHGALNNLNRCITIPEANTLAIIGFSFWILTAILFVFTVFLWAPADYKSTINKNELYKTNFDLFKNKLLDLEKYNDFSNNNLKNITNDNTNNIKIKISEIKCLICSNKTNNIDEIIIFKCQHIFHEQCLTKLCNKYDIVCSICNKQIVVNCNNV